MRRGTGSSCWLLLLLFFVPCCCSLTSPSSSHLRRPLGSVVVFGRRGGAIAATDCSSSSSSSSSNDDDNDENDENDDASLPALLRQPTNDAIWSIARPAMAIGFLRTMYGVTDAIWIGRLGAIELEAMGAVTFASWMLLVLGGVAGTGVHAVCSFHEGAGERNQVGQTVCDGLWICALFSVAVLAFSTPLFTLYFDLLGLGGAGATSTATATATATVAAAATTGTAAAATSASQVRAAGLSYLRWTAAGTLPMAAAGAVASGFKGIGLLRPALAATAFSVAFNAVLDPLLIWGCPALRIPRLGVAGAALATNLSSLLALVLLLRRLCDPKLGTDLRLFDGQGAGSGGGGERRSRRRRRQQQHFRWGLPLAPPRPREMLRIASIGSPMAASGLLFSAVYVCLGRILTGLGPSNLGALGLGQRLESLQYTVNEAFGAAAATLVGQWLGAGEKRRARSAAADVAMLSAVANVPFAICGVALARPLVRLFTDDAVVAASAVSYLRIVSVVFPISAVETAYEGALAGAGDTVPTLLSGLLLNTARIPLAAALAAAGGGNGGGGLLGRLGVSGVSGVWVAIAATTVAQAATKQLAFRFSSLPAATGSTTKTEPARRKQ